MESLAGQSAALVRVLDQYLAELEAGRQPDRLALLADHPDLAGQLEPALAGLDLIHSARGGSRQVPDRLGDFRIEREVGRGGMGVVYEAEQISLKRRVALKVLRYASLPDPEALQRFQREAETVAGLHHTNIVPIFAIGKTDDLPYYAMQFIEGESLVENVRGGQQVAAGRLADWGLQAAEALAHAHQRGVIHRDIKPSNLILDPEGRIWLTDFGLAKRVDDLTLSLTGVLLGTPRYMSPEQASSLTCPVDHRTDIYSLGATLYELATGGPIFQADSPDAIIGQILTAEPPSLRGLAPSLPRDLETIILKCLEKNPARRYGSALELAEDLRAFRDGRAIRARRASLVERAARWVRKHRRTTVVASVSALASVVLMTASVAGWRWHHDKSLALLSLTTSGPNLLAEVLTTSGQPVVPAFPVPSPEAVALPAGSYLLRLSASGLLSETWPLELGPGEQSTFPVSLRERWLWPPMELTAGQYPEVEVARLSGRDDLMLLLHDLDGAKGEAGRRLRRINGATGKPTWEEDLVFTATTMPAGGMEAEWRSFLSHSGLLRQDSRLLPDHPDIDGDGTGELIWISRHSPSLLAVSGETGQVLWWHRALPPLPGQPVPEADRFSRKGGGTVVGRPVSADVDGDGLMDFLTTFQVEHAAYREADGRAQTLLRSGWLSAVSGKTGVALWQYPLGDVWPFYRNSSDSTLKYEAQTRPLLARREGKLRVMLLRGEELLIIDAATGQEAGPAVELGFEPFQAPLLAGPEGEETVLVLRVVSREGREFELLGYPFGQAEPRWKRAFRSASNHDVTDNPMERVYRLEDLGGESGLVIVLATTLKGRLREGAILEAVSVRDGSNLWRYELPQADSTPLRFLSGPDLNGDAVRDLFTAYVGSDLGSQSSHLNVVACSGHDGRLLWLSRLPHSGLHTLPDPSGDLLWWQDGADGWPLLVVPVYNGHGRQPLTFFVSAGSGRVEHLLPDVVAPRVGDFDGDGLPDLFYMVSPQNSPRGLTLRGEPAVPWARLGNWHPAQDLNGDGFTDLLSGTGTIRSGSDGSVLSQIPDALDKLYRFLSRPGPEGDLDGDSVPDLILFTRGVRQVSRRDHSLRDGVRAYSGRTGQPLWEESDFELGSGGGSSSGVQWSAEYPALAWVDLEGGKPMTVLVLHSPNDRGLELVALKGRTGKVCWRIPAAPGTIGSDPSSFDIPWLDLTGDGVKDPVVWAPLNPLDAWNSPCRLQAFDGQTGGLLWEGQDLAPSDRSKLGWPLPQVADLDGDGHAEVIVALHDGFQDARGGYAPRLVVVDGRSGVVKWSWSWQAGWPDLLPPLVVSGAKGRMTVALTVQETAGPSLVLLSPEGEVLRRTTLSGDMQFSRFLWSASDVDGDGGVELLFRQGSHLTALSVAADRPLWSVRLPGGDSRLLEVPPALAGEGAMLAVWSGTTVLGVDGGTGRALWRSQVPNRPVWGSSSPPTVKVLQAGGPGSMPRVWFNWPHVARYDWLTLCREAWPLDEAGLYQAGVHPVKN